MKRQRKQNNKGAIGLEASHDFQPNGGYEILGDQYFLLGKRMAGEIADRDRTFVIDVEAAEFFRVMTEEAVGEEGD